ncbi:Homeobox protein knotted-1-like 8 [Porphyridium purpureum]|uniref:Homeobox protein knotted-1-like 8 n=1 Tax=Porphyridium purpureum TaxID=35688 RepID=A0A5J4YVP7_PORPP|nr:Homeobox protein knotted-1-like 8 [Porphyridium purpureum]|eukprot:POR9744..scf209_3
MPPTSSESTVSAEKGSTGAVEASYTRASNSRTAFEMSQPGVSAASLGERILPEDAHDEARETIFAAVNPRSGPSATFTATDGRDEDAFGGTGSAYADAVPFTVDEAAGSAVGMVEAPAPGSYTGPPAPSPPGSSDEWFHTYISLIESYKNRLDHLMRQCEEECKQVMLESARELVPVSADVGLDSSDDRRQNQELRERFHDAIRDLASAQVVGRVTQDDSRMELKKWAEAHIEYPYPTDEEVNMLVAATDLDFKQVKTWFHNWRKREWRGPAGDREPASRRAGRAVTGSSSSTKKTRKEDKKE